jgi:hypothetical protein
MRADRTVSDERSINELEQAERLPIDLEDKR